MDDRIRQIIGKYKNKVSVNTDTNVSLTLDTTTRLIKTNANPINSVIGVDEQFELERNESNLYRMLGRLNIVFANELTEESADGTIRGSQDLDWDPLFTEWSVGNVTYRAPNNWVLQVCYPSYMSDRYNVWGDISNFKPISLGMKVVSLTSNNPSGNRSLLVVETVQKHRLSEGDYVHLNDKNNTNQYQGIHKVFELGSNGEDLETKITLETSWKGDSINEMFLNRVVNSSDDDANYDNDQPMTSFNASDITGGTTNSDYITITVPNEHGLGENGFIEIRHTTAGLMNGLHRVTYVIDDFRFTIRFVDTLPTSTTNYTYRRMDGTPSEYYVREFELLTSNEYDTYPTAFSSNVYPKTASPEFGVANKTWSFHLTKDLNTTSLIGHRGGLVNELKFCMLKRAGKNPFDWSNVTSHWEFDKVNANTTNGLETVSNNTANVGSIVKNIPKTLTTPGSRYIGDIVEYNRKEIKEKIITEVIFRFGVKTGILSNQPTAVPIVVDGITYYQLPADQDGEGYYYKPFKTIEIRKYSKQIEKAEPDELVDGVPGDYELYPDGSLGWRDLLTPGFIEEGDNGVDWPFVNGRHHIYINNYTYIRRQKPFEFIDQSGIITVNPKNAC